MPVPEEVANLVVHHVDPVAQKVARVGVRSALPAPEVEDRPVPGRARVPPVGLDPSAENIRQAGRGENDDEAHRAASDALESRRAATPTARVGEDALDRSREFETIDREPALNRDAVANERPGAGLGASPGHNKDLARSPGRTGGRNRHPLALRVHKPCCRELALFPGLRHGRRRERNREERGEEVSGAAGHAATIDGPGLACPTTGACG